MKKYTIILVITFVILLGFFTGVSLYKINTENNNNTEKIAELIEDECTYLGEIAYKEDLISANNTEKKTSPNCTIILKLYYKKCGHIVEKKKTVEEADINLTEEELKQKFIDWELQKFTPTEIVLYKEIDEYCGEHYLLKEKEGYIEIYNIDNNNTENLLETTDISTEYLEEEDLNKIKNGIYINSKKELNKILEDFE